jgi:hypothetical protein
VLSHSTPGYLICLPLEHASWHDALCWEVEPQQKPHLKLFFSWGAMDERALVFFYGWRAVSCRDWSSDVPVCHIVSLSLSDKLLGHRAWRRSLVEWCTMEWFSSASLYPRLKSGLAVLVIEGETHIFLLLQSNRVDHFVCWHAQCQLLGDLDCGAPPQWPRRRAPSQRPWWWRPSATLMPARDGVSAGRRARPGQR